MIHGKHCINPPHRTCGTPELYEEMLQNPEFQQRRLEIERQTALSVSRGLPAVGSGIKEIPVVVHVVASSAEGDISDDHVRSQIAALNRDFRARNDDLDSIPAVWKPLATDTRVQFALASVDPAGNTATGITRTTTAVHYFSRSQDAVKDSSRGGIDSWDSSRYLNIWVYTYAEDLDRWRRQTDNDGLATHSSPDEPTVAKITFRDFSAKPKIQRSGLYL